ncbi:MAG: GtrA family protein [Candidatus Caldatribacterium sp.]|uniref:GtrA family protein n=1 Tax=Candidatus Caldatribacterium sp. TaxID=2282143 RepID=UPI0029999F98|nr:GtrA family protein [Candidatus Caldatribacterium sp.]MCX7731345.1 GtrA family protein [Candidatus Caldatribacterium sp.]MDW8081889.1 GtrA family protein [Candidatus Calescibacterium sp.]
MRNPREVFRSLWQLGKFTIVGVANTLIDFGVFMVLHGRMGLSYPVSQVVSYSCGMTNSYLWNKFWTFRSKKRVNLGEVARFILVNLASLGVALAVLALFRGGKQWGAAESKALATLGSLFVNFLGNRFWVFRER